MATQPAQAQSHPLSATDPTLAPFLAPTFSPAAYLNSVLPTWPTLQQLQQQSSQQTALSQLTLDAQELLTRLTTQLTRLTTTLNTLTDEILRSGGRLAYEVEVLRGDAGGLHDALHADSTGGLKEEFRQLGVDVDAQNDTIGPESSNGTQDGPQTSNGQSAAQTAPALAPAVAEAGQPEYIRTLRTLTTVRANLDRVVTVFGAAIDWVVAPSEVATRAGAAPAGSASGGDGGGGANGELETQGREFATRLKDEIAVLLDDGGGAEGLVEGIESAEKRVAQLRELLGVWKGTVEERPRARFVDGLAKMVEDFREKKGV